MGTSPFELLLGRFSHHAIVRRNVVLPGEVVADFTAYVPKPGLLQWAELYCGFVANGLERKRIGSLAGAAAEHAIAEYRHGALSSVMLVPMVHADGVDGEAVRALGRQGSHHAGIYETPVIVSGRRAWLVPASLTDTALSMYRSDFERAIKERFGDLLEFQE